MKTMAQYQLVGHTLRGARRIAAAANHQLGCEMMGMLIDGAACSAPLYPPTQCSKWHSTPSETYFRSLRVHAGYDGSSKFRVL